MSRSSARPRPPRRPWPASCARTDSVLLDLNLSRRTGLDVMRAVRPRAPDIAFVVLTNHSESQYRQACLEAGARYFLDKSGEFERVREVIAEIGAPHPGA